jgi:protein phosphatase
MSPAPPIPARIDTFGLTDTGKVRSQNEDQFLLASLDKSLSLQHTSLPDPEALGQFGRASAQLFIVADGVGGVAGGQLASGTAVQALAEYIGRTAGCYYNYDVDVENEFLEQLERAVERAHERVRAFAGKGQGPATTVTMVTLVWPRAYVIHVGDSRGYYLRQGRLRQFTRDQTMGELLVDEGVVTEEQARSSRLDNVLASAVGGDLHPSIGLVDLQYDDSLLLCTDGLTKHVSDDQITEALQQGESAEQICRQLVTAALEDGGTDNVTVVVGRMNPPT